MSWCGYGRHLCWWRYGRARENGAGWGRCCWADWRGWVAYVPSLSWVRHSSRVINGARGEEWMGWGIELMGWGAVLGLAIYCAAYVAGWALFVSTVGRPRWELLLKPGVSLMRGSAEALRVSGLAALAWVALEWVRGWMFSGFGWNGLGVALHENKILIQAAGPGGRGGVVLFAHAALRDGAADGLARGGGSAGRSRSAAAAGSGGGGLSTGCPAGLWRGVATVGLHRWARS